MDPPLGFLALIGLVLAATPSRDGFVAFLEDGEIQRVRKAWVIERDRQEVIAHVHAAHDFLRPAGADFDKLAAGSANGDGMRGCIGRDRRLPVLGDAGLSLKLKRSQMTFEVSKKVRRVLGRKSADFAHGNFLY